MFQTLALDLLKSGKNVFLTGQAGSGKTYVINSYVQWLWSCNIQVAITASTGIAATHIGGVTIHSRSGIGIKDQLTDRDMELLQQKEHLHKTINKAKVLIIDEISMLSAQTLDSIDRVVQMHRRDGRPFGGMQVVFVGDFFQLPPVMPRNPDGSESTKRFAFAAQSWKNADLAFCYLSSQHRQQQGEFSQLLNALREGKTTATHLQLLKTRLHAAIVHKQAVKLYTHTADVDRINIEMLMHIDGEEQVFHAQSQGEKNLVAVLKKSLLAPEVLRLKLGAQVIFLKNNPSKGYLNGTTGKIIGFAQDDGYPLVQIDETLTIKAEPELRSIENADEVVASVKQVPLKLAWAITVHKSQGMTLDAAQMDLSRVFEPGQAYVALSRIRSLDGLSLLGINEQGLQAHPLVLRADRYFKEQSQLLEEQFSLLYGSDRQLLHKRFVTMLGGTYTEDAFLKEKVVVEKKTKLAKATAEKGASIKVTCALVKEGKNLEEIMTARGLAESTILEHIFKISRLYPEVSLSKFAPEPSILAMLQQAKETLLAQEDILDEYGRYKLKAFYEFFQGKLSYETIRRGLLFV